MNIKFGVKFDLDLCIPENDPSASNTSLYSFNMSPGFWETVSTFSFSSTDSITWIRFSDKREGNPGIEAACVDTT